MLVKVKKLHDDAVLPKSAQITDAGADLVAIDDGRVQEDGHGNVLFVEYKTGIAIEPPPGYHTEIFPRSSVSKKNLVLANSIGLVDEDYRGEILVRFKVISSNRHFFEKYNKGERIAQLVLRKTEKAEYEWADELSDTQRGAGGFGSTGS